jgi:hypothetical protein
MFDVSSWQQIQAVLASLTPAREIRVIAVSKGQGVAEIRAAAEAGVRLFGESYVQEALEKQDQVGRADLEWHFIGRIQRNKTRLIASRFHWVHGVTEEGQARRLSEVRTGDGQPPLPICLQVNVSGETSKGGVSPAQLPALADAVAQMPGVTLRGLMAPPAPLQGGEDITRRHFAALRQQLESLRAAGHSLDTLSMGMSGDYPLALEEGATLLRLGTILFGRREN